ncbi:MAG: hypothetical protein ABEJ02_00395 [Candidatus Paceibacteria bacterium]
MSNYTTKILSALVLALLIIPAGSAVADEGLEDVVNLNNVSSTRWQQASGIFDLFSKSQCGDGVIQGGEACDPPGKTVLTSNSCNNDQGNWVKKCTNSCDWNNKFKCQTGATCGNGIIEGSENCDDGQLNGQYGQCAGPDSNDLIKNNYIKQKRDYMCLDMNDLSVSAKGYTNVKAFNKSCKNVPLDRDKFGCSNNQKVKRVTCKLGVGFSKDYYYKKGKSKLNVILSSLSRILNTPIGKTAKPEDFNCKIRVIKKNCVCEEKQTKTVNAKTPTPKKCSPYSSCKQNNNYEYCQVVNKKGLSKVNKCADRHPQFCGNGKLDFVDKNNNGKKDPDEPWLEACDTVGNTCVHSDKTPTGGNPCSNYADDKSNSCAANCQSAGNYCGDGIVQEDQGEECDDGNDDNSDRCKNDCTINEKVVEKETKPQCGNGVVDEGEACDQGKRNGLRCDPKYGESCTYCSADCQNVLTVDPNSFCGNGNIDRMGTSTEGNPLYESCEIKEGDVLSRVCNVNFRGSYPDISSKIACDTNQDCNNKKLPNSRIKDLIEKQISGRQNKKDMTGIIENRKRLWNRTCGSASKRLCVDKGSFECSNQCKNLQKNCAECVRYQARNAIPKISVLNPLIAGNEKNNKDWGKKDINDKDKQAKVTLYRPNPPQNLKTKLKPDKDRHAGPLLGERYFAQEDNSWVNPSSYNTIITKGQGLKGDGVTPAKDQSIESNKLCNEENPDNQNKKESEYKLFFNRGLVDGVQNPDDYVKKIDDSDNVGEHGDLFEYDVNGEQGSIRNTVIASPPVPPKSIRVVVKWTDEEGKKFGRNSMGKFGGHVFVSSSKRKIYGFSKTLKNKMSLTSDMAKIQDYWRPQYNVKVKDKDNKTRFGTAIHNIGSNSRDAIQSMTIEVGDRGPIAGTADKRIPFYVTAIGKPMQPFQDGNLEILVYTYHENQDSFHSIYRPTLRFKINKATKSKNPRAPFWHVFNLNIIPSTSGADGYKITDLAGNTLVHIDTQRNRKLKPTGFEIKEPDQLPKRPKNYNHGKITTRFCSIKEHALDKQIVRC